MLTMNKEQPPTRVEQFIAYTKYFMNRLVNIGILSSSLAIAAAGLYLIYNGQTQPEAVQTAANALGGLTEISASIIGVLGFQRARRTSPPQI